MLALLGKYGGLCAKSVLTFELRLWIDRSWKEIEYSTCYKLIISKLVVKNNQLETLIIATNKENICIFLNS